MKPSFTEGELSMQNSTNLSALSQDCVLYDARENQTNSSKKVTCSEGESVLHVVSEELHISGNECSLPYILAQHKILSRNTRQLSMGSSYKITVEHQQNIS